jgi:GNAT superfamily N-acetyltransferase
MAIRCTRMRAGDAPAAIRLLKEFLSDDEFYLDSSAVYGDSGGAGVERAVETFLRRPQLGFVWLAYLDDDPAGVCIVCYAISTSVGGVVAKLDDVYVAAPARNRGVGKAMLGALAGELRRSGVGRIDTAVHIKNAGAARFYAALGYRPLHEERLSLVL